MINKVWATFDDATADIPDGAMLHIGGMTDWPSYLLAAVARRRVQGLTVVSCNMALRGPQGARPTEAATPSDAPGDSTDLVTVGLLLELGLVKKGITSFSASMRGEDRLPFEQQIEDGRAEVELNSQGVLAERVRSAKAGIPAFYTTTGVGTPPAAHKEVREFNRIPHVLETALYADFALIRARAADRWGNLVYDQPSSFNHTMAGAARVTIAEVAEIVPLGELGPAEIKTAGAFVDRVVLRPGTHRAWTEAC